MTFSQTTKHSMPVKGPNSHVKETQEKPQGAFAEMKSTKESECNSKSAEVLYRVSLSKTRMTIQLLSGKRAFQHSVLVGIKTTKNQTQNFYT